MSSTEALFTKPRKTRDVNCDAVNLYSVHIVSYAGVFSRKQVRRHNNHILSSFTYVDVLLKVPSTRYLILYIPHTLFSIQISVIQFRYFQNHNKENILRNSVFRCCNVRLFITSKKLSHQNRAKVIVAELGRS